MADCTCGRLFCEVHFFGTFQSTQAIHPVNQLSHLQATKCRHWVRVMCSFLKVSILVVRCSLTPLQTYMCSTFVALWPTSAKIWSHDLMSFSCIANHCCTSTTWKMGMQWIILFASIWHNMCVGTVGSVGKSHGRTKNDKCNQSFLKYIILASIKNSRSKRESYKVI